MIKSVTTVTKKKKQFILILVKNKNRSFILSDEEG